LVTKRKNNSTQNELVQVDVSFPSLKKEIANLEKDELESFFSSLDKIESMTWAQIYATSSKGQKRGLNWEPIQGQTTRDGKKVASIRITKKFRARVVRDGVFMRFVSLHPDHDSAYQK
jgi:hypothetical protein